MQKFLAAVAGLLLVAVVGTVTLGLIIGFPSINAKFHGRDLEYTAAENQVRYDEGYADCQNNVAELIDDLENTVRQNQSTIAGLRENGAANQTEIARLEAENAGLNQTIQQLRDSAANDQTTIANLQQIIEDMQTVDITCYCAIFVDGTQIVSRQIVRENDALSEVTVSERRGYRLNGWLVDDVLVEDITAYPITADTIFIASWVEKPRYNVTFWIDDESIVKTCYEGETVTPPEPPVFNDRVFEGWTLDSNSGCIEIDQIEITFDMEFFAHYYQKQWRSVPDSDIQFADNNGIDTSGNFFCFWIGNYIAKANGNPYRFKIEFDATRMFGGFRDYRDFYVSSTQKSGSGDGFTWRLRDDGCIIIEPTDVMLFRRSFYGYARNLEVYY